MKSTFFKIGIEGAVAHLIMNKGDKANSMTEDFWHDLPIITRELEKDTSVRVMVISGDGKHFSGGMELSSFDFIFDVMTKDPARASYALRDSILRLQDTFTALEKARFPVIAAVHGACIGAAIDLICACDMRIAAENTKFSIEEINVGMAADVGTLQRLPKLIAPGIVKELSYTGRRFTAQEAKSWGFVNSVHPDHEQTLSVAISMAQQIASKSPVAVAGIKRAIDYAIDHTIADGLQQVADWNGGMLRPEELKTAIDARKERREAIFADFINPNDL